MRVILVQADDGHWYLIPANRRERWDVWKGSGNSAVPTWATRVNGPPDLVEFDSYVVRVA